MPVRAVLPADLPDRVDRALVAVKSHHTRAAAELLRDRLAPDGYVVSLQNGMTARRARRRPRARTGWSSAS